MVNKVKQLTWVKTEDKDVQLFHLCAKEVNLSNL